VRAAIRGSAALLASGAKNRLAYMKAFVARNLFLAVILYVFQALWKTVYSGRSDLAGYGIDAMVWYLVISETVLMARSALWRTVQDEVKDGTVAYGLLRPASYPLLTIMRFLGEGLAGIGPIFAIAGSVALLAMGPLGDALPGLGAGAVLMAGSLLLSAQMEMLIGLAAFSMEDVTPLFWIQQKIIFIFGGLFFPLDLYPDGLARILKMLPFAFVCHWPASVCVRGGSGFPAALAGQAAWIVVLGLLIRAAYRAGIRRIESQGG